MNPLKDYFNRSYFILRRAYNEDSKVVKIPNENAKEILTITGNMYNLLLTISDDINCLCNENTRNGCESEDNIYCPSCKAYLLLEDIKRITTINTYDDGTKISCED